MRKFTFIVLVLLAFCWQSNAQSIVIGTGTTTTNGTGSDPIDDYYSSFRYQVVYTAAELSASLTPYDEITALGWSVSENGGQLLGYTIKMGHTSATNSAAHDASVTSVVKNAFDYTPTVTAAGVFDMIAFDTNFVWNGVDNVLVEVCSDGQNPFSSPYGGVRGTTLTTGSRFYRVDGDTSCGDNTDTTNGNRPNIQFNYIDGTPPACLAPTAITVDSFTATTAEISWTAGQGELDWEIVVQAAGTGAPGAADNSGTDTGTNPHSATGLTAQTAYEVYVRADCSAGAGTDFSAWAGPINFTTACAAVSDFSENFDSVSTPALPNCWSSIIDNGASSFASVTTSTSADSSLPNGVSLYNSGSTATSNIILVSPVLSNLGDGTHRLVFNGRNSSATQDIEIGTLSDPTDGSTFTVLTSVDLSTTFDEYKVSFAGYSGTDTYIGIRRLSTSTYTYVYLDDISWEAIPSCDIPSDLAVDSYNASSVTLSWTTGPSSETAWEAAIQPDNTGTPSGSGTATSSNPYIHIGLTPDTAYEVYVRADCGGGDYSNWIGPVDFTTDPIVPPSCPSAFTATPDASCGNNDTSLSWDDVSADGYRITVGTTSGGNDVLDDVDLGNVTSTTVSSQTNNTTYYYTVSPYNVVGTNTTCTEQTYTTFVDACLCDSMPTSNDGAGISNVRIGFDDYATGDVFYFDHSGPVNELSQGVPINVQITFATGYAYHANIWIDLNDNGDLTDPGELVFSGESLADNPTTLDASFTVPSGFLGAHKMRIGTADSGQETPNPCYSGTYGVTLDFDVNITAPSCTPAVIASTTVVDNCATGQYNVEVDVTDPGTATFIIGTAPVPITSGINVVGPFDIGTTSPSINVIDVTNSACNIDLGTFDSDGNPPSDLVASNITGTTADLAWTVNGNETAWEVLVLPAGDPAPLGTTSGTDVSGANPYTATGLTAQTSYDAYVRGMCGTDPEWVGPETFTTPCPVFTPSYSEDFTTFLDQCWEEAADGDLTAGPATFGSANFNSEEFAHLTSSGGGAVNINIYTTGDIEWLLSPTFDLSADGYQLEVDVALTDYNSTAQGNFSTGDQVLIVYSNDGTNWTTLVTYDDTNEPAAAGQTEIVDLTGVTGASVQFAFYVFEGTDDGRDIDFHIDNFKVRTPPTCFDVSGLSLDSVSTTTADISWTNAGAETNWEVAVQAAGTGLPSTANDSGANTAINPYTATGLTAQTDYEVYVRAECTLGSEFGEWVGPFNFTTACAAVSDFSENFDSVSTPALPDCWSSVIDNGASTYATVTTSTSADSSLPNGVSLYNSGSTATSNIILVSPVLSNLGDGTHRLVFNGRNSSATQDIEIGTLSDPTDGSTFTALTTVDLSTTFDEYKVSFAGYSGTDTYIGIRRLSTSTYTYVYLDDISWEAIPACLEVSAITLDSVNGTTADISWTSGGSETAWEVAVQAPGTGEPLTNGDATTSNPYTATGLTPETDYEVYVRANCTATSDGFSTWTGPFNFTTTVLCPDVTGLTIDSFTDTTAEISWTAGGGSLESGWEIVVQADGTGSPESGTILAATNPYSATGLTAETAYEVYVRGNCDADGFSNWVGPVDFTTACAPIIPDYTADMSTNAPDSGDCWIEAGDGDELTGPSNFGSGLWYSSNHGGTSSNAINLYTNNRSDWIISPTFDLSTSSDSELLVYVALTNGSTSGTGEQMGSDDAVKLLMTTDDGSSWSTLETWAQGSEPSEVGETVAYDLPTTGNSRVQFAFYGTDGTINDSEDVYFHVSGFTVREKPACSEVLSINVSNITTTSADIAWTNGGSETAWEVAIQTPGTGTPDIVDGSGADSATNPYNATGLAANTAYEVYVRAECTAGTLFGEWVGPVNFSTPCEAITVFPYTEDFEADNTCWSYDLITGTQNWQRDPAGGTGDITGPHGGDGFMEKNYSSSDALFTMPAFDLTAIGADSRIKVWLHRDPDADTDDRYRVFANTTNSLTGATQLFELYSDASIAPTVPSQGWYEYIINIPSSFNTSDSVYIIFQGTTTAGFSSYDLGIDDFTLEAVPNCQEVTAVTASNITATSADITWTNGGSETAWEFAIQAAGTGEPATADGSGSDLAANSYNATGLTSNTAYEVYVRAECVAGTDFGAWVGPFNFTTTCAAVSDFSENFDSVSTPDLPDCWSSITDNGASSFASVTTSTSADSSLPNGVSLYNSGSTATSNIILVSPVLSNLGDGTHRLRFNGRNSTATQDIEVGTLSDPTDGSTFTALTTVDLNTTFDEYEVSFAGYSGTDTYIGVRRLSTSTYTYVYLDDITWEAIPSCLAVSNITVDNITTTSADINWTNADSETAWEVAVQPAGTGTPAAADGSGTDTTSNPHTWSGLTTATEYEVWVRAECVDGTDFGAWVGPVNFSTACDAFSTFPYTEGFESGVPPTCWTSFRGTNDLGATYDWTTSTTANSGSGAAYVRFSIGDGNAEDWLVTPEFDFSALTNPEFSFYTREGLTSDYGSTLTVRVSTTDTAHASFTTVYTSGETDITTYNQLVIDLSAYAGQSTVYVAIVWANDDGDSLYVDDVAVYDNIPGTYTYTDGVWSPSTPANDLDDIIIASGNLVISSDLTCNTMTVNPGASVTVDAGTTLEATNGLTLESSSTSYSSLIPNGTIVGTMEYERHVNINGSGTTGSNDLVSAPLTGQQFNDFAAANPNILTNTGATLYLFGPFEKNTGSYVTWSNTETATLDAGVGYRAGSTDNGTFTFTGNAETGTITHNIVNQGTNNQEWNLVGNPYPSYLNVQQFLTHDVGGVVNIQLFDGPTAAIYGYDGSALNGWTIYNLANTTASTRIAPGQGFMVSANAANVAAYDLEFTPAMRSVGTSDDFIVGRNAELTYVKLNLSANEKAFNTEFYFNTNASTGFDVGYDANLWGNTTPEFALYSHLVQDNVGDPVALQALSHNELDNVTIPLGVNANQGEQLTFSIEDINVPASVKVYLEDVVANTVTLLNETDYIITPTTPLNGTGRFFLRTSNETLSTIDNSLDLLDIFTLKSSKELVVSGQLLDTKTMLTLYDTQGRLVLSTQLDNENLQNRIDVSNINSGVYIVTVQSNDQEKTKKVIID